MRIKGGIVFIAIFISILAWSVQSSNAAQIEALTFNGIWRGGAFNDDQTHHFSHCVASALYKSGITMYVAVGRTYGWTLGFADPAWNLQLNRSIPLTLAFDGGSPWTETARPIDAHSVRVDLPPTAALIGAFRGAYQLSVVASGQLFGFNLDGTSRLLVELSQCVGKELALERGEPPPQYPAPSAVRVTGPTPAPSAPGISIESTAALELAATRIASNLLLESKLPNARILSPKETPAGLRGRGVAWTSDAGVGTVELLADSIAKDPQDVAAQMISSDASDCKGDFASGRSSELIDGKIVTKSFTVCKDSGGTKAYRYFVLKGQPAGYIVYAIASAGGAPTAPEGSPLSDANFQVAATKAAFSP